MRPLIVFLFSFFQLLCYGQDINLSQEEKDWIQQNPTVEFAFSPEWKPFEIIEDGSYSGIANEFLKIISKKTGLKFKGVYHENWESCLVSIKAKKVQLIPCLFKTPERESFLNFTQFYAESPTVIATKMDYPYVQNLDFFNGKKLAMARSYSNTEFIEDNYPDIEIVYVDNSKEAIELVSTGEADGTVENLPIISYYIYYEGYQNLKVAAPVKKFQSDQLHMAVHKDDVILCSIINKVFDEIYPREKNEIFSKWISVKHDQTSQVNYILKVSGIIIGAVLVLLIIILLWNKRLKKEVKLREVSEKSLEEALVILSKQNEEKKTLLNEIHHRVKNNLQVINSLLNLQSMETEDERSLEIFKDAQNRVVTMALLHEKLYQTTDLENLDFSKHFDLLAKEMIASFSSNQKVRYSSALSSIMLDSKTMVSLALILNEFITNTMKYAFKGVNNPEVFLGFKCIGKNEYELIYTDNGVGARKDLLHMEHESLGISLIKTLTEQLEGEIEQMDIAGTGFKVKFNYQAKD
jgi:two-component sensor histidine kinase/ABC-type amino acid transport substrate-binding protein